MKSSRFAAFTLIELIGVLGIIAVLAGVVLLSMIRHLDILAQKKEAQDLRAMAGALKQHILATRAVTNQAGWAAGIAAQLGLEPGNVSTNARRLRRVFLIDPNLGIGTNNAASLPYIQGTNGHTFTSASGVVIPPVSPRLMLISSVGAALPSGLTNGVPSTIAFNDIWLTADGAVPTLWSWPGGRGEDLKIERIDLSDLFVPLVLNNRDLVVTPNPPPSYRVDTLTPAPVPTGGKPMMYLLKGTELKLYNSKNALEYSEILVGPRSFTHEFGTWQGEAFWTKAVDQTTPIDLDLVMRAFMMAPTNVGARFSTDQTIVSNAMVTFMNTFIAWRNAGYPGQPSDTKAVETAQQDLAQKAQYIIDRP